MDLLLLCERGRGVSWDVAGCRGMTCVSMGTLWQLLLWRRVGALPWNVPRDFGIPWHTAVGSHGVLRKPARARGIPPWDPTVCCGSPRAPTESRGKSHGIRPRNDLGGTCTKRTVILNDNRYETRFLKMETPVRFQAWF